MRGHFTFEHLRQSQTKVSNNISFLISGNKKFIKHVKGWWYFVLTISVYIPTRTFSLYNLVSNWVCPSKILTYHYIRYLKIVISVVVLGPNIQKAIYFLNIYRLCCIAVFVHLQNTMINTNMTKSSNLNKYMEGM